MKFTCSVCGIEAVSYGKRVPVYCSRACMAAAYRDRLSGTGNPAWRGGKWKYRGSRWATIAAEVIARDGACADCGTTSKLVAHHLIPQRFWRDLETANAASNLIALCGSCHAARPEHYWRIVPGDVFDPILHVREGVSRTRADIRPYPNCGICGAPCKRHRSRFCSRSCANRARWRDGVYGPDLVRNITRTRWELP